MNIDEDIPAKAVQSGSSKKAPTKETVRAVSCTFLLPLISPVELPVGQSYRLENQEGLQACSYRLRSVPRGQFPYPRCVYKLTQFSFLYRLTPVSYPAAAEFYADKPGNCYG